jgi:hypothetical protein
MGIGRSVGLLIGFAGDRVEAAGPEQKRRLGRVEEGRLAALLARQQRFQAAIGQLDDLARLIQGSASGRLLDMTRTLMYLPGAGLVEPRETPDNGPKVPRVVDRGAIEITSTVVRFTGSGKRVEWSFRNLRDVTVGPNYLAFEVSNRKSITGFKLSADLMPLAELALETARRVHVQALAYRAFRAAADQARAELESGLREVLAQLEVL